MRNMQLCNLRSLPWRIPFLVRRISFGGESIETIDMEYAVYKTQHTQLKSPPILIMHGIDVTKSNWRRTCRIMAKKGSRAVIAVDARNHEPNRHVEFHTPKHMAADTAEFIKGHQLIRIVALGHSLGGRALMTLALTEPDLVEKAIFVDTTPGKVPKDALEAYHLLETMIKVLPTIPNELSLMEGRKLVLHSFVKLARNDYDMILIIKNLMKTKDGTFAWRSNPQAMLDGWDESIVNYEKTLRGLKPYQGQTLLIGAKRAKFVTRSNIKLMRKYFPNLQVEYLDAEHKVHMDQPEKFIDLVVNFTKSS